MIKDGLTIHPSESAIEAMEDRGVSAEQIANATGIDLEEIKAFLQEDIDISIELADAFEKVLGISSSFWMNLQSIYNKDRK